MYFIKFKKVGIYQWCDTSNLLMYNIKVLNESIKITNKTTNHKIKYIIPHIIKVINEIIKSVNIITILYETSPESHRLHFTPSSN